MRTRAAARAVVSVAGACNAPAAAAPRVSEGGMMRRVPSAVALLEAAQLVRTESGKHLQMHLQMIASGEHPLKIEFSLLVALSSLLYLIVAHTYFRYEWHACCVLFCLITVCSLFADSVAPRSKFVTSADRVFASLGTLVSPVRVLLWPGLACWQMRACVIASLVVALSTLVWSRQSPDMRAFAQRHTLWHVVSVAALTWLAHRDAGGVLHLSPFAPAASAAELAAAALVGAMAAPA